MASIEHVVEIMALKVGASLRVNGFGVFGAWSGRPAVMTSNLGGYLIEGWNRVEVDLERVPPPEGLDGDPVFEMRLFGAPRGEPRTPAEMWLGLSWTPDTIALRDRGFTRICDHRFAISSAPAKWRFLSAPALSPEAAATAAGAVVGELASALRARKLDPVGRVLGMRFTELALGADVSRAEIEDAYLLPIGDMMAVSSFTVEAAAPGDLEVVPAFDGRVHHVRARGGRAPVVLRTPISELAMPISIAEIDGRPAIVR